MGKEPDHTRAAEPSLAEVYGGLYTALHDALRRYNPLDAGNSNFKSVYYPIMGTILPKWREIGSQNELSDLIRSEFAQWCGNGDIGPAVRYRKIGARVWQDWLLVQRGEQERRDALREGKTSNEAYTELYYQVLKTINAHNPVSIAFLADEYTPEAETILPRLREAHSPEELTTIVCEEFVRWFGEDTILRTGPSYRSRYEQVANDLWAVWSKHCQEYSIEL